MKWLKVFLTPITTDPEKINLRSVYDNSTVAQKYGTGHRGRDRMVVGFTTTCAITAYHH